MYKAVVAVAPVLLQAAGVVTTVLAAADDCPTATKGIVNAFPNDAFAKNANKAARGNFMIVISFEP